MSNFDQFLKTSLKKYRHPDVAKSDVVTAFRTFTDLRPKVEDFVFNDGSTRNLLQLDGTIPVTYKGNVYNIPICIWLMDTHPYNPPMVYVKPTTTMQIKSGRNVDQNGKVDLPYLREWKYPDSDLYGMIQILTIVFGEEPPVYSRSAPPPSQPPRYPGGNTPYPASGGYGMPMPGVSGPQASYPSNTPYPNPGGYPASPGTGYPGQFSGYNPPASGYQGYPSSYPSTTATSSYPSNPPYPSSTPYSSSSASSYPTTESTASNYNNISGTSTVTEEHLKASLLSAVEDKMRRSLRETFQQAQAEMDVLYKTQADLLKGKDKLEQMMADLDKEKVEIEGNVKLLRQKDQEVKEALGRMENQDQISIDEAVDTTAPLYRQLLKAFAEEQAIEDAMYYLGIALRKNVIDLEVFLKNVRELSRKQFMLRALIQKCREKAGLPAIA
ncbi:tumor susceptibility gene 101 protein-like [Mya arenaria]|uniref:tumor susceptibility gene 101 protein-like n=1 Tax=Mya arenaria TaxID=6604 RepID=UPI0022E83350|nr:tumor susceptibility gene 101 protein-like [Mya arenaria]